MPMRSSTQPTSANLRENVSEGGYLNQSQTFHPFYQPRRSKRKNWTKFSKPTASLMTAQSRMLFTMPRQLSICLHRIPTQTTHRTAAFAKSFTIRQNKPKNPWEICELPGFILMEIFLQFYNAVIIIKKFCGKLIFFKKGAENGKILISLSKYLRGWEIQKTKKERKRNGKNFN